MKIAKIGMRLLHTALTAAIVVQGSIAQAAPLNIADVPLFLNGSVAPLNMLTMGRDHKLYYEAYNDASDLNDDSELDVGYRGYILKSPAPATGSGESLYKIDYYGYFDSYKCYVHNNNYFEPTKVTADKTCGGSNEWSGDWLNWATMTRMDALRKVLYGGDRSTDGTSSPQTVLERSFIPQDAHGWVKEYISTAVNGYDIRKYTPYSQPNANSSHLFGNTTLLSGSNPLLRVLQNQQDNANKPLRAWNWASIERPVIDTVVVKGIDTNGNEVRVGVTPSDFIVRVRVCRSSIGLENNCRAYVDSSNNTTYKPVGLLQNFGENDTMKFGLISGSYANNTNGGVLRSPVGSIKNEINLANGTFNTGASGIIATLNNLRVTGFGSGYQYSCGWITTRAINNGECQIWGNPIAEMMYEGLRYFAGRSSATADFSISVNAGEENGLGLPVATWDSNTNPYRSGANASCAKPFETVISDINPSYDTDKLPGSPFTGSKLTDTVGGLDVNALGQKIWNAEFGAGTKKVFIGEVGSMADSAPTVKDASSFGNIRGLAPEEPTKQGGYYAASVAYHGRTTDLNTATGDQKTQTFAVALASPLPRIQIPMGGGKKVTLVPFAKSVNGASIDRTGSFQPTDQIVDFYVDSITATSGKFRVNFEDVEQGADHDMDAIAVYEYAVNNGKVDVTITSEYAAGGITQHMGYVISGTTRDGIYLEVTDQRGGDSADDVDYRLDTPPGQLPGGTWNDNKALPVGKSGAPMQPAQPIKTTRTFEPGSSAGAELLKDPLWYAAKYGGFQERNDDITNLPDKGYKWTNDLDASGNPLPDANPSNYFLVTNALTLEQQLTRAFAEIVARTASASSAAVNAGSISSETRVYQAKFNSGDWSGQLLSFPVNLDGTLAAQEWDAALKLPAADSRKIITVNANTNAAVPFRWASIGTTRQGQLQPTDPSSNLLGQDRLSYLRGDDSKEITKANGVFRKREKKLGDIVSSSPLFVGKPPFFYPDNLESQPYSAFVTSKENRIKMVYAGANDGMLHGFDAITGAEQIAFIPGEVFANLHELTKVDYTHRYFVDGSATMGDVFYNGAWHTVLVGGLNKGGQGIYALDITDPSTFNESNATSIFRWEFRDADNDTNLLNNDLDLGYTYSRPAIARMKNGKWVTIFGNGYNNTQSDGVTSTSLSGNAVLYIVDIETGNLIRKIDTLAGMTATNTTPNGLNTPAVVDINGDSIADYIYAGDLRGNLWKFDVTSANPLNWEVDYTTGTLGVDLAKYPLFIAKDASGVRQPITTRPEVGRGPRGAGMVVLFGTGKFMETADKTPTQTQTFYGILDPNTGVNNLTAADPGDRTHDRSQLVKQQILVEQNFTFPTSATTSVTIPLRVTSNNAIGLSRGWYMDLLSPPLPGTFKGEMQVSDSVLRNGRVIFTTVIPDANPCSPGGSSWLMELDALTGSRLAETPFDNNRDGKFDDNDNVTVTIDGVPVKVPVSGLQSEVGIAQKPGVLTGEMAEYKYLSGTSEGATGNIQRAVENPGANARGRQSWRQIR